MHPLGISIPTMHCHCLHPRLGHSHLLHFHHPLYQLLIHPLQLQPQLLHINQQLLILPVQLLYQQLILLVLLLHALVLLLQYLMILFQNIVPLDLLLVFLYSIHIIHLLTVEDRELLSQLHVG